MAWSSTAGFHHRSRWMTWGWGREVEPGPAGLERDEKQLRALGLLEPPHHLVAGRAPHAPVEPQRLGAEPPLQVRHPQLAPRLELGETQHLVALFQDLLEQLLGAGELARAAAER